MAQSVEVSGLSHGGIPIPQASVVGNLLVSGGISPIDTTAGRIPEDVESQVAAVFANAVAVVRAAGGSPADIVKMTAFVADRSIRSTIDKSWLTLFPDAERRPARHTLRVDLSPPVQIQLEIIALIGQSRAAPNRVQSDAAADQTRQATSLAKPDGNDPRVARLLSLDSCSVSDALDRLGIVGTVTGLLPLSNARRIAGRAVTVHLGSPGSGQRTSRHLGTAAVDASSAGDVIVVGHQGRMDCAGWGGLLSRAAAARGIEGVLVDGAARDLGEAAECGLAVYARGEVPLTARGRAVELSWGEPITFGGVEIGPGDLVLADRGGVVVIPGGQTEEVLAAAERIAAVEAAMARAIDSGVPVSQVMDRSYEELLDDDL